MTTNNLSGSRSYEFTTRQNEGARTVIPSGDGFPEGSLVAEFDDNSHFASPVVMGVVDWYEGNYVLTMTPFEVNKVRNGHFRIAAVMGSVTRYVAYGKIRFVPAPTPLIINDSEVLTASQVSTVALTGNYNDLINKPSPADTGDVPAMIAGALQTHTTSPAPHPVYDDLPSLNLLFENGLM